jgi:hypothetical protein
MIDDAGRLRLVKFAHSPPQFACQSSPAFGLCFRYVRFFGFAHWALGFAFFLAAGAVVFFVCSSLSRVRESAALNGYSRTDS